MTVEQQSADTMRVLVVLTQMQGTGQLIARAVDLAALGGGLVHAIYLIDADRTDHIGDCLTSRGFVGTAMAQSVKQIASEAAHESAEEALSEIRSAAAERGVPCETELVHGRLLETVARVSAELRPKHVLLCRCRVGLFARLFGERDLKKLQRELGGALELVEPGMASA